MSINNSILPKLSTSLFWLTIIGYGFLLLLHFLTGFGKDFIYQVSGIIALFFLALRKTSLLMKYSTNTDYLEFSIGHFFSTDEMQIKSNLIRVVKSDIEEIELKGFFMWRKLKIKMVEDDKKFYIVMPLRFVSNKKVHFIIEDIIGVQETELPEASEVIVMPVAHSIAA